MFLSGFSVEIIVFTLGSLLSALPFAFPVAAFAAGKTPLVILDFVVSLFGFQGAFVYTIPFGIAGGLGRT
jgi:hypothetical protein